MTDWMWCSDNPKEAAALIDRLRAEIVRARDTLRGTDIANAWVNYPTEPAETLLDALSRAARS